jgi:hypothetical protein
MSYRCPDYANYEVFSVDIIEPETGKFLAVAGGRHDLRSLHEFIRRLTEGTSEQTGT